MDPETLLIIFIITGVGGVVTYAAYHCAERLGPELKARDLLPCLPWEGPPVPRFLTKPEILDKLMRK